MSPTKSKDPSPSKSSGKPKTPAVEPKPRAPGTRRKSAKGVADIEEANAVNDAKTGAPITDSAPTVSDAQAKSLTADKAAKDVDATPKAPAADSAPTADVAKVEPPADDAGATAAESTVIAPAAGTELTAGESNVQTPSDALVTRPVVPPVVTPSEAEAPAASNAPPAEKPLDFPKGALIAYRKSGGLKFSSREIVVYPDGRVTYDGGDKAKSALTRAARKLSDAQVMRLRRTLEQVNFFGMKPPPGQQDPDSFVIEIAARLGGKNNQIEVSAGNMPGTLNALIEQLAKLLPSEE